YWDKQWPWRGRCMKCNQTETMEHILFECEEPGQSQVWRLVRRLWARKESEMPEPYFANMLATPLLQIRGQNGTKSLGDARLMRIITTEAAHLIWRLRNKRVIQREGNGSTSEREIRNRFLYAMSERLQMGLAALKKNKARKRGISTETVLRTWKGVIKNEGDLPEDWAGTTRVLVGIAS
ncbi:hypothetical protein IW261DRAFT_1338283, partial [Armillaria novae-zelandiae]